MNLASLWTRFTGSWIRALHLLYPNLSLPSLLLAIPSKLVTVLRVFGRILVDTLHVRQCTIDDLETLMELGEITFRQTFAKDNTPEDMDAYVRQNFSAETLGRELSDNNSSFFLVQYQDLPVAYMKLNRGNAQTESNHKGALELQRIYVLNEYKHRHIGKLLLDTAIRIAQDEGATYLWLGVWEHNTKAIAFYLKQGFVVSGTHHFILGSDTQTDHIMKLSI